MSNERNELVYRPNKNVFIFYLIGSLFFCLFLIGFIFLIATILWYKFSYIVVGEKGLTLRKGWLNIVKKQVPYDKINTVEVRRSLIDRWFGSGQLKIFTGNDVEGVVFNGIDKPEELRQIIEERAHSFTSKAAPVADSAPTSAADEIAKYASLKKKGVITEEEFEAKKKQLLG